VLLLASGGFAVAFIVLFDNTDPPPHWKRGLIAGATLVGIFAAVLAVPGFHRDGRQGSDNSGTTSGTTSSGSSQSASPSPSDSLSPSDAAKKQFVNATTDVVDDAQDSKHPKQGPLLVSAQHIVANSCSGAPGWRVPLAANKLGAAPFDDSGNTMPKWAKDHHGVEVSGTRIELTLQGATKSAIVIKGVQINIVSRDKPSTGTHVIPFTDGCGGNNDTGYLVAMLGETPAQVYEGTQEIVNGTEVVRKKPNHAFSSKIFYVSRSDPEKFVLVAFAPKFDYKWQLVIRWLSLLMVMST
jgi:hypothetical protein